MIRRVGVVAVLLLEILGVFHTALTFENQSKCGKLAQFVRK